MMIRELFIYFLVVWILVIKTISAATCSSANLQTGAVVIPVCSESEATAMRVYIDGAGGANSANVTHNICTCNVTSQDNSSVRIDISTPEYEHHLPSGSCGSRFELQDSIGSHNSRSQYTCSSNSGTYNYAYVTFTVTFRKTRTPWAVDYCLGILPPPSSTALVTVKCFENIVTKSTVNFTTDETSTTHTAAKTSTTPKTDGLITTEIDAPTLKTTSDARSTNQTTERTSEDEMPTSTLFSKISRTSTLVPTTKSSEKIVDDQNSVVPIAAGAGAGALMVLIIVIVLSVFLCRSKKGKEPQEELKDNHVDVAMVDVDMVENALYISTNTDENETAGTNSSTEIRHIEMEGGDVYALPSKGKMPANA